MSFPGGLMGLTASAQLTDMVVRLGSDLLCATILIHGIYWRLSRNREYIFTYYLLNLITFSLCAVLSRGNTTMGVGLALFGVFGILRYRTEQIRIRDLTYLFIVIGLAVLHGVASRRVGAAELLLISSVILGVTATLELGGRHGAERSTPMLYDQLEILRAADPEQLKSDIHARTGLTVRRVEVIRIDLLRDAAEIVVFHSAQDPVRDHAPGGSRSAAHAPV